MSMGLEKCCPSYGISVSLLGRRWLELNCPGDLRERFIRYQESCVQGRVVNQRLNRGEELENAYTVI